ncbi:MAG: hypothetical protein JST10_10110 [Bacteroidetes bacterium]|nr:hypothetical protein [Bacteroidota bacterium]MBS1632912.1 hypothetical protein [Bacteroidota bacterium]
MDNKNTSEENSFLAEHFVPYAKQNEVEEKRLIQNMMLSDMDKFKKFCRMMRIGKMLASAKVSHYKPD